MNRVEKWMLSGLNRQSARTRSTHNCGSYGFVVYNRSLNPWGRDRELEVAQGDGEKGIPAIGIMLGSLPGRESEETCKRPKVVAKQF